ncbi:class I adenylate-forming enzyme family protein [Dinoroseobacter sp. S375]|uniref:class I adenylate-forming enzyme family protein n=1 Tax=Dinoroseobacter sp. S375 TaxID=3415136 RepID=UPI003C7C018E
MTGYLHDLIAAAPDTSHWTRDGHSYGNLRAEVSALAETLARHGVHPGDRVMLITETCRPAIHAILALSRLGATVAPVNARHTPAEIAALRTHLQPRAVLITPDSSPEAAAHGTTLGAHPLADGLAMTPPEPVPPSACPARPEDRIAAILYTTGTTQTPKGVMLSHANLCWNARTSADLRDMVPGDLVLAVLPITHIFGFASVVLSALATGARLWPMARFDPARVAAALAAGVSVFPGVPQMFARLISETTAGSAPDLRYLSAGGAPLDPDWKTRIEARYGLPLHNGYGMTEASPGICATRPAAPRADISVGTALRDVRLRLDPEGALELRSPGVMRGYFRDPLATRAALTPDGWLRTGDLARIDPDGAVHILGRAKELIIRGGFNIYPPEVEAALSLHPDVAQAAVIGRPRAGDEEVLAFVQTTAPVRETALRDWLRADLAPYKIPARILVVDRLPTAPTGKILKHKLLDMFAHDLPHDLPPETETPCPAQ